jgi:RNA-directed DNA polymerase
VHGRTEAEAQEVRAAITAHLKECGLELHLEKTKIAYPKNEDRRTAYPNEKFDFLGDRTCELGLKRRAVLMVFGV